MVSPLVLIHPAEEDVEQIDEQFLGEGEGLAVVVQPAHDFVGDVDDFSGLVGLPVVLAVSALHEKAYVVGEAVQDFLLLSAAPHHPQEAARHVLAGLHSFAQFVLLLVVHALVHDGPLELLRAVVVGD